MARDKKFLSFFKPGPSTSSKLPTNELPTAELPVAQRFIDMEIDINERKNLIAEAENLLQTRRGFKPGRREELEATIALSRESVMRQEEDYETEKAAAIENGTYYRSAP